VKSFLEKNNIFFEKYVSVFGSHEKIKNAKIRVRQMSSESGDVWSPLPDSGMQFWQDSRRTLPDPVGSMVISVQIWPNSGSFGQIPPNQWPDPARTGRISGRIRLAPVGFWPFWPYQWLPDPGRFGQISGRIRPDSARSRPFWPDPVGF
jgi:hypothetical protein